MGRVVKSFGHVVPKPVLDAREEAAALLARAQTEADALRAGAGAVREAARREGFETGRADGVAEAAVALAAAHTEAARLVAAAGPTAIALATKMAEKIVGRAVALAPETMAAIAGEALAACRPGAGTVRVRDSPRRSPGGRDAPRGAGGPRSRCSARAHRRRGSRSTRLRDRDGAGPGRRAPRNPARRARTRAHRRSPWLKRSIWDRRWRGSRARRRAANRGA